MRAAFGALRDLGDIHVVAPKTERSACSHTITLRRPIHVEPIEDFGAAPSFAVDGTPADCVRLAVAELIAGPIDLVVAGINRGANAGVDTYYSGTIAAAREAAMLGLRSIALSQAIRTGVETDWPAATDVCTALVRELMDESLPGPGFWSVNLPAPIPENPLDHVHRVPIATHPMPIEFERTESEDGRTLSFRYGVSYWLREVTSPSDYATIRDGDIAVSAVPLFGRF